MGAVSKGAHPVSHCGTQFVPSHLSVYGAPGVEIVVVADAVNALVTARPRRVG